MAFAQVGVFVALLACYSTQAQLQSKPKSHLVHAFYYLWYGEPKTDSRWFHWNHEVLPHWDKAVATQYKHGQRFKPARCIHSPYYPHHGPYSSRDPEVVHRHIQQLLDGGVEVLVLSWWGPKWRMHTHDTQGVHTDDTIGDVVRVLDESGSSMRVAFHLEPYEGRTAASIRDDVAYLMSRFSTSPALLRIQGKPVYYVYDSYRIQSSDWADVLSENGNNTVRNTELDGVFIGLWLDSHAGDQHLLPSAFDGFYTYFASEAVSYGSNPLNWPELSRWASTHHKLFIPSVGPGYNDSKIRPWNAQATRGREEGARYQRLWDMALKASPAYVSITSFNEWGEGTQIEPAVRVNFTGGCDEGCPDCEYQFYDSQGMDSPELYMQLTRMWSQRLLEQQVSRQVHGVGTNEL